MECSPTNPQPDCPQAHVAAEEAVRKVFAILGVDVDVPSEVERFREDLRFGSTMRRAADRGTMALVVVIVGGIAAATWSGVLSRITGAH